MCYSVTESASFRPVIVTAVSVLALVGMTACDSSSSGGGNACVEAGPYSVGDVGPSAGYIFFVDDDNDYEFTYLEAAPKDLQGPTDDLHEWAFSPFWVLQTDNGVGTGESNTARILLRMEEEDQTSHAIERTVTAAIGGCDDWFVPSEGELDLMHQNLFQEDLGDFTESFDYWSSTETAIDRASGQQFGGSMDGYQNDWLKTFRFRVRPARSF